MGGGGGNLGQQAAQQEAARQARITAGSKSIEDQFAGFTPSFYQARAKAYQNFALPQLATQARDTQSQMLYNLANRGLQGSGAAGQQTSKFNRSYGQAQQTIADTGITEAQTLQKKVQDQKNSLYAMLYQSADPAAATQQATSTAASYAQPSAFAPIANMFGDVANSYYLSALINQQNRGGGAASPPSYYNSGAALPKI